MYTYLYSHTGTDFAGQTDSRRGYFWVYFSELISIVLISNGLQCDMNTELVAENRTLG